MDVREDTRESESPSSSTELRHTDSRFTRSRTYSLDLFSIGQPRCTLPSERGRTHAFFKVHPTKSPKSPYALKHTVKNTSFARSWSVPISPVSRSKSFSRNNSSSGSSDCHDDDKSSARRLIKNLVTIFTHSRSPASMDGGQSLSSDGSSSGGQRLSSNGSSSWGQRLSSSGSSSGGQRLSSNESSSRGGSREGSVFSQPLSYTSKTSSPQSNSLKGEDEQRGVYSFGDLQSSDTVSSPSERDVEMSQVFHTPPSSPQKSPTSDNTLVENQQPSSNCIEIDEIDCYHKNLSATHAEKETCHITAASVDEPTLQIDTVVGMETTQPSLYSPADLAQPSVIAETVMASLDSEGLLALRESVNTVESTLAMATTNSIIESEKSMCESKQSPSMIGDLSTIRSIGKPSAPTTSNMTSIASLKAPITLRGVVSDSNASESTLSASSGEECEVVPGKRTQQPIKSREKKERASKARKLVAKARVSKRQERLSGQSKRNAPSKSLPRASKRQHHTHQDYSLPVTKRSCHDNRSPVHTPSKPGHKASPPKGVFLATILTDIPEVDICPLSAHKTTPTSSPTNDKRKEAAAVKASNDGGTKPSIPSQSNKHKNIHQDQPSHSKQLKKGSKKETDHHKLLMRWQKDCALGANAETAPMLYANEKLRDRLNSKGPWIEKAKMVWSVWRRGVSKEVKEVYLKRARNNRTKAKNARAMQSSDSLPHSTIEGCSEEEDGLSPTSIIEISSKYVQSSANWEQSQQTKPTPVKTTPICAPSKTTPNPLEVRPSLLTAGHLQTTPSTYTLLTAPCSLPIQLQPAPIMTTSTHRASIPVPTSSLPTSLSTYIPLQMPIHLDHPPTASQWAGLLPLHMPTATIPTLPATNSEKFSTRKQELAKKPPSTVSGLTNILLAKSTGINTIQQESTPFHKFTNLNLGNTSPAPLVSSGLGRQTLAAPDNLNTHRTLKEQSTSSWSTATTKTAYSASTASGSTVFGGQNVSSGGQKAKKIRKEGLSSRLSSHVPLTSPTFVIPQLEQSPLKKPVNYPQGMMGPISVNAVHNSSANSQVTNTPVSQQLSYVIPSMLKSSSKVNTTVQGVSVAGSVKSWTRSVSLGANRLISCSSKVSSASQVDPTKHDRLEGKELKRLNLHCKDTLFSRADAVTVYASSTNSTIVSNALHPLSSTPVGTVTSPKFPTPSTPSTPHPIPSPAHNSPSTPCSLPSPSTYYNSSQYRISVWKKIQELNQMRVNGERMNYTQANGMTEAVATPRTTSSKSTHPSHNNENGSSKPQPLVVQPAMRFSESSQAIPIPPTTNSSVHDPSTSTSVKPTMMVNAAYTGDFSSMSLWEMQQLYVYNKAILYRQRKITKLIKAQLLRMQQEERICSTKKLSRVDLYKRFLHFLVEPKCTPSFDLTKGCTVATKMDILDPNSDRPVLKKELDIYGSVATRHEN